MAGLQITQHPLARVHEDKREVEETSFSTCLHRVLQVPTGTCWKGHHWGREGLSNAGIEFRPDNFNFEAQKPQRKLLVK